MTKNKMAVIGCGNMARSLIIPMAKNDSSLGLHTYTPTLRRAKQLAEDCSGFFHAHLSEIPLCKYWLIACKPQQFSQFVKESKGLIPQEAIILSILAGVSSQTIQRELGVKKVVRIMSNTPSLVGKGVSALYFSEEVDKVERNYITELFSYAGSTFSFEDELEIDKITGFSGSGPAYFFEICRIMTEKMVELGIKEDIARQMIFYTVQGSAEMMCQSSDSFKILRDNVTSKGGATFEALRVFEKSGLEDIFGRALDAAYKRVQELAR